MFHFKAFLSVASPPLLRAHGFRLKERILAYGWRAEESRSLSTAMFSTNPPTVVVVGAGASGLAAAARLAGNGIADLVVLEGRNRTGGRISTLQIGDRRIEEGASWIHGTEGNPISSLAKQTGSVHKEWNYLEKIKNCSWHKQNGEKLTADDVTLVVDAYKTHCDIIDEVALPSEEEREQMRRMSWRNLHHYLEEKWEELILEGCDEEKRRLLVSALSVCYQKECQDAGTGDLRSCAVHGFAEYLPLAGCDATLPNGYSEILKPLLRGIPRSAIRLNSVVERIEWSPGGCRGNARCKPVKVVYKCAASGKTEIVQADHVIVTAPLGCIRDLSTTLFTPSLPDDKMSSCRRITFDVVDKIALLYDKPFWSPDHSSIGLLWDDVTENHWSRDVVYLIARGDGESPWLETWLCGKHAKEVENLTDEEVGSKLTEILRKFVGSHVPKPSSTHVTRWGLDRFARGSYISLNPNSFGEDIDIMAEPLPGNSYPEQPFQLLFAGEGTSRSYFGTAHGAVLSGEREADRLLRHYMGLYNGVAVTKVNA